MRFRPIGTLYYEDNSEELDAALHYRELTEHEMNNLLSLVNPKDPVVVKQKLKNAKIWDMYSSAFKPFVPSATTRKNYEDMCKKARALQKAIESASVNPAFQTPFLEGSFSENPSVIRLYEDLHLFTKYSSDIILGKNKVDGLARAVFKAAFLYEDISGRRMTTNHSDIDNALITEGEKFVFEVCKILARMKYDEDVMLIEAHADDEDDATKILENLKKPKINETKIKGYCEKAAKNLRLIREKEKTGKKLEKKK